MPTFEQNQPGAITRLPRDQFEQLVSLLSDISAGIATLNAAVAGAQQPAEPEPPQQPAEPQPAPADPTA